MNSSGQNTGVGSHSLLQGIFPTQGLNPGLSHRRRILYQLSHQGNAKALRKMLNSEIHHSETPSEEKVDLKHKSGHVVSQLETFR